MIEREWKKGGKSIFFSPIGKKYAYFFHNRLKIYQIAQKKPENFSPASRTPSYQISFGE